MSPLWSDLVEVFLGARTVELKRTPARIRRGQVETLSVQCDAEGEMPAWRTSIQALAKGLAESGWTRADAVVTLSSHFVRYALVPPVSGLRRGERVALARQHFEQTYGDAVSDWDIAIEQSAKRSATFAAAVDRELLEQLVSVLRGVGLRPRAIEPILVRGYNAFRRSIAAPAAWIAVTEPGRACVAHMVDGEWRAVRNQRVEGPLASALPALLEQTRLSSAGGAQPGLVYLIGAEDELPMHFSSHAEWQLNALGPIA